MPDYRYCPVCGAPLAPYRVSGEPHAACSAGCGFIHYDNPVPVLAAVVEHEGLIVLARNVAWPASWYGLITGFLEKGERPEEGVLREVKEELNLDASAPTLIGVYPFARMNQVIIAYHVAASGEIRLNEELADYRRIPPEKLRTWPAGTGEALRDWLRSRGYQPETLAFGSA